MKQECTTGNWYVIYDEDTPNVLIFSDELEHPIAECDGGDVSEAEANAKIMAASKDMYNLLKVCFDKLSTYGSHPDIEKSFDSVMKKANGEINILD